MCYVVPAAAAIATTFAWRAKKGVRVFWLMLMFYGGALFGLIDHLWNGELLLISENWVKDFFLGVVITAAIVLAWGVFLSLAKKSPSLGLYLKAAE